jgi:ADP-ribose pyrophosphatase YjhB (NUDIX family)
MNVPPKTPLLTVDIIVEMDGGVVLVERRNPPPGWALPGGFVDVGEQLGAAAAREAREETSLDVVLVELFHAYSAPARDPRGHAVSVVFIGRATGRPVGADDAARAAIHPLDRLPPLAFDHALILEDYLAYRRTGRRPPVNR